MPRTLVITESQLRYVTENTINELIKFGQHEYTTIKTHEGHIHASAEGILGDGRVFISWDMIREIMAKFNV